MGPASVFGFIELSNFRHVPTTPLLLLNVPYLYLVVKAEN